MKQTGMFVNFYYAHGGGGLDIGIAGGIMRVVGSSVWLKGQGSTGYNTSDVL